MKLKIRNPHGHKQSLDGIKENIFVLPGQTIEVDSNDFYQSELERVKQFLFIEEIKEVIETKKSTAKVDNQKISDKEG